MIDFKLGKNGDFDFTKLDIGLVDGAERVKQQLEIKLNTWVGEWFLDLDFGTDWLGGILGKENVTLSTARAILTGSCLEVDGVNEAPEIIFDFNAQTRQLNVDLNAVTSYGLVTIKGVYNK